MILLTAFSIILLPGISPIIFFFFFPNVKGSILGSILTIFAASSLATNSSPISSTRPSSFACVPVKILPSANFRTSSTGKFLPSATASVNCL